MSWITNFTAPQLFLEDMIDPVILRGTVLNNDFTVFGRFKHLIPGIGFVVTSSNEDYLIVDNFAYMRPKGSPIGMDPSPKQASIPDDHVFSASLKTRLFWLLSGYNTKAKITGLEVRLQRLLDPMSEEGIGLSWGVEQMFPLISPADLQATGWPTPALADADRLPHDIKFLLTTGMQFPHCPGDMAPLPIQTNYQNEEHAAHRAWHIARAKWVQKNRPGQWMPVGGATPHLILYTFDEAAGVVTYKRKMNDQEHPLHHIYHVHGQPPSLPPSPAAPFVLGLPPNPSGVEDSDEDSVDSMSPIADGI
jgi:hypothetical protein